MTTRLIILDRDGTLIHEPANELIDTIAKYRLLPGVAEHLPSLRADDVQFVLATNQDGLGTTQYPQSAFDAVQTAFLNDLEKVGVTFMRQCICPHIATDACTCRKPHTQLFDALIIDPQIDWPNSIVIGDRSTDVQLAHALGAQAMQVSTNLADEKTFAVVAEKIHAIMQTPRRAARMCRQTKETAVHAALHLDGTGVGIVKTGLGFFDHMLTALLHHASIDHWIVARGDLHVDEHHTVEDVAIVLGGTLHAALQAGAGIQRFGFLLPMDDSLAEVAIDLGGRPYSVFNAKFQRERVGDLPTELVSHFFYTLAMHLRANVHCTLRYSDNDHHAIEALFKACGRALRMACEVDARHPTRIASTKGVL